MSWLSIFDRIALRFRSPRSRLSAEDQLALAKVTARITGHHPTQYMVGLHDERGIELKCPGYERALVGSVLVGTHSATFGPFPTNVTVVAGVFYAPITGDPIARIPLAAISVVQAGATLTFNCSTQL